MEFKQVGSGVALAVVALASIGCGTGATSSPGTSVSTGTQYAKVGTIRWKPAPATDVDISWVDAAARRYFVSDRTNGVVHIVNVDTQTEVAAATNFAGATSKAGGGPNGLVYVPTRGELWVGDGDSSVKVVDARSGRVIASVATGGSNRVDELTYDSSRNQVVATNPDEPTPYFTVISVAERRAVGKVDFPMATNGLEQPAFNREDGNIYEGIPSTKANPAGEVAVVDPGSFRITRTIPVPGCYPKGLAFGLAQHLLVACGKQSILKGGQSKTLVIDAVYGNLLATIPDVGGADQAWYNPGDNRYYVAASDMQSGGTAAGQPQPVLGVIEGGTNRWLTNIPTSKLSHSVAVDPRTGRIFLPSDNGIAILAPKP